MHRAGGSEEKDSVGRSVAGSNEFVPKWSTKFVKIAYNTSMKLVSL